MQFPVEDTNGAPGPIFSVVVPTYNQAELLREALDSVLGQSFQRFEVAVVDNHSSDRTSEVLDSFKDERVQVYRVHNQGVIGVSRNVGIWETKAPLIAFLDSDDTWHAEKLQRVFEAWEQDPKAGLVCHDEHAVRHGRIAYALRYGPYREDMYQFLLLNGCRLSTSATVVGRAYLEEVGGFSEDPNLAGVEDYDLWLRLSRVCRFNFLHQPLGQFRLHPQSHSASSGVHLAHTLYLLDKHFGILEEKGAPLPKKLLRRERATRYAGAARTAVSWWGKDGCLAYCLSALRETPFSWKTYARVTFSLTSRLLPIPVRLPGLNGIRQGL